MPLYPAIRLDISRADGPFYILGAADAAMVAAGLSDVERDAFTNEAMSGDYEDMWQTAKKWFDCTRKQRKGAT